MREKSPPPDTMMRMIIRKLSTAPDGQTSDRIKEKCLAFLDQVRTPTERFDFLAALGEEPLTEISPFVKVLCKLGDYHKRPTPE